jgi:Phloem protein 2
MYIYIYICVCVCIYVYRFLEVAEPIGDGCWLSIVSKIDKTLLSPRTKYGAYLIYKLTEASGCVPIGRVTLHASVTVGNHENKNTIFLEPFYHQHILKLFSQWNLSLEEAEFLDNMNINAKSRADGWMEVEIGTFYNSEDETGNVIIKLTQDYNQHWKGGLVIEGVEIKPKY